MARISEGTTHQAHGRVLLLSMPFHALERPSLGLGLLQAGLRRLGEGCDVRYLGLRFAEFIGLEEYLWVHGGLPYTAFAGDWIFTSALYGERPEADARYVQEILRDTWRLPEAAITRLLRIRAWCDHFLDHCLVSIPWPDYDVVGFTSTFEQNIASLALARRVKAAYPSMTIAFGGANWEAEMGETLHQQFPFVDVSCSGEADRSFPQVVSTLRRGGDLASVPGIVFRRHGRSVATGGPNLINDLDELPLPDYDDFYQQLEASPVTAGVSPLSLLETSRGCWWGARQHCTFCGLNGGSMAFRSKSADRVIKELHQLRDRYGVANISVVDNILDMRYFTTLLPRLAEERLDLSLFYEVKANLRHDQVRLLAAAGIRHIQPGLESLSDHVLGLMGKGTTALQNIQLLKWCREFGIRPEWNLLYGFPGETPEDYQGMLPLVEAIGFLQPPSATGPVRLDRFSPYHANPTGHGMTAVRPLRPYTYLYPFDPDALMRIAYYFDFDYADRRAPLAYAGPLLQRVQRWMDEGSTGALWCCPGPDGTVLLIRDTPTSPRESVRLGGWQADLYQACDRVHGRQHLLDLTAAPDDDVIEFLSWCVHHRLMARVEDRYLALAVHTPPRTEPGQRASALSHQHAGGG
jgi:ribosomal peptide maturation radical SAM protein 1